MLPADPFNDPLPLPGEPIHKDKPPAQGPRPTGTPGIVQLPDGKLATNLPEPRPEQRWAGPWTTPAASPAAYPLFNGQVDC